MHNMQVITDISIRPILLPMVEPHRTASGVINESPLILIDIMTNEGVVGHGVLFTYTQLALRSIAEFLDSLKALLIGEVLAPLNVSQRLQEKFRLLGTQGFVGMALAGIDMAMWDALARSKQQSLVAALGGKHTPTPVYGAVGFDGEKGSAHQAEHWAKQGFKGVKAKIGYASVNEDIAVVRAMRQAVGPDVSIMVDYNQSLSPADAIHRSQQLDQEGLTWIEEPTLAHNFTGHAHISNNTRTTIQCGENWWGIQDVQHAIDAKASDYFMLDAMKIGGVTGWMKAAAMAEAVNVPVSSHLWSELSASLLSCSATANWLEYCDWWNPLLQQPLMIDNGMAIPNEEVGSGIEWNEAIVDQYKC